MIPFKNLPIRQFDGDKDVRGVETAIGGIKREAGREYPLVIGRQTYTNTRKLKTFDPSAPSRTLAVFQKATQEQAEEAINLARETFESWKVTSAEERSAILLRAAEVLRRRRDEAVATTVLEAGKNWIEADAELAEAVDFLEFYAREALRYAEKQPVVPFEGEEPELFYIPLGVGAVIPPWNFPLAILTGMTSAAIVTGNTVILKPASDTPLTGQLLFEVMIEAGLPEGVLTYLTGSGGEIGDFIVEHPQVRFIAFTGSMEVGLGINERAARLAPGQVWIKRVVAEMGGKDAIIIDEDADLDAATEGIIISAFGYQGQKCSACSRLIVHERIYEPLMERVVSGTEALKVGPPEDRTNYMGPVINQAALDKIMSYVELGHGEGRLLTGGTRIDIPGYFIEPTIFAEASPDGRLAQEEIFGPLLTVMKVRDFDEALAVANNTIYGLTGAVYSRNEGHLARAREVFHVGNLYFNHKCTGAMVGVHPFGGFNMSGTDSKAGGPDYLGLFLQAKSVSRKV
ncbi:MAG: L-glutamate gamma-semialdehyde dehydrogenase [Fidelibacterota bacterium]|nr:MAG: L-glutamate gamma-semialdehyde dehydrogenase [Candidatus Neomarinimicrobiota bacterium]